MTCLTQIIYTRSLAFFNMNSTLLGTTESTLRAIGESSIVDDQRPGDRASEGIHSLLELREQYREVADAIRASRTAVQEVPRRIRVMSACKGVHEDFQNLERNYRTILEMKKRAEIDSSAWATLEVNSPVFRGDLDELLNNVNHASFPGKQKLCIEKLELAIQECTEAIDNQDIAQLTLGTDLISEALARDPAQLNTCLINEAEGLQLSNLIQDLRTIAKTLDALNGPDIVHQRERVKRGIASFSKLDLRLRSLIAFCACFPECALALPCWSFSNRNENNRDYHPRHRTGSPSTRRIFTAFRISVGAVLVVAAQLKAYEWLHGVSEIHSMLGSSTALSVIIFGELLLGLALLFGMLSPALWWAGVLLFTAFAVWSGYSWISGIISCGCLGRVNIYPFYMLVFDVVVLVGFAVFQPRFIHR